jgi:ribosomal protein S5
VIECEPWASEDVVKKAVPFASVAVPSTVVPSKNCTVPVAAEGVTTAVKVTAPPMAAGFGVEANATDEEAWTVSVTTAEVAGVSFASPA